MATIIAEFKNKKNTNYSAVTMNYNFKPKRKQIILQLKQTLTLKQK